MDSSDDGGDDCAERSCDAAPRGLRVARGQVVRGQGADRRRRRSGPRPRRPSTGPNDQEGQTLLAEALRIDPSAALAKSAFERMEGIAGDHQRARSGDRQVHARGAGQARGRDQAAELSARAGRLQQQPEVSRSGLPRPDGGLRARQAAHHHAPLRRRRPRHQEPQAHLRQRGRARRCGAVRARPDEGAAHGNGRDAARGEVRRRPSRESDRRDGDPDRAPERRRPQARAPRGSATPASSRERRRADRARAVQGRRRHAGRRRSAQPPSVRRRERPVGAPPRPGRPGLGASAHRPSITRGARAGGEAPGPVQAPRRTRARWNAPGDAFAPEGDERR